MTSYRGLVDGFMKRAALSFDAALTSLAGSVRALSLELTRDEAAALKKQLPPELRQLVVEIRSRAGGAGTHDGRRAINRLAETLDISESEAKRRLSTVLAELRALVEPWDDVHYVEFLDRLSAEIDGVPVQAAVA